MKNRSYNQFCALAFALDVVGERWTLLIIRELLPGPRRYKDLLEGLPGISTNLLAERLKDLEQAGLLCRRVLPPPAGSAVYELLPAGQALEPAVLALGRWGARRLPASLEGVALPSLGALSLALKAFFHPEQAQGLAATYDLCFGAESLQVHIEAGALEVQHGHARRPDAVIETDVPTFLGLFTGRLAPEAALAAGLARVEGDPAALGRFLRVCHVPGAVA
jgi:DNA-binding HxlR family transcriptional regulator